jgi:hypothetical protein
MPQNARMKTLNGCKFSPGNYFSWRLRSLSFSTGKTDVLNPCATMEAQVWSSSIRENKTFYEHSTGSQFHHITSVIAGFTRE